MPGVAALPNGIVGFFGRNPRVQTIKTAIVVLLMMTVAYGCYVSFTSSPEPLPDHIVNLIEESGGFDGLGVDPGMPESISGRGAQAAFEGGSSVSFSDAFPDPTDGDASFDDEAASLAPSFQNVSADDPTGGMAVAGTDVQPSPTESAAAKSYPTTPVPNLNLPDPRTIEGLPPEIGPDGNRAVSWNADSPAEKPRRDLIPSLEGLGGNDRPSPTSSSTPGKSPVADTESSPASSGINQGLANAIRVADRQFQADQPAEALATLSLFYDTPGLSESERQSLLSRLDPLAAIVIYSRRHLLEKPHRVGPSETLMEVASRFELPWQLLANINAIDDPVTVLPGTELKVVRGPFRAEVDLDRRELTIFLGELYAGRFPVRVGSNPAPREGSFQVLDKQASKTFFDRDGSPIPADDPRNPYGNVWIGLGDQLCIHGSSDPAQASDAGCISLKSRDAEDLFGILGQGSTVTIRR